MSKPPAILALEDGTVFHGTAFGAEGEKSGEVVFNTGMTGYQEVLTDPSYKGQIVTMTYTQVGNYGITPEDAESWQPWVEGFVVRESCEVPSNWRSAQSMTDYLRQNDIIGIEGLDTRKLTRHIRNAGAQIGVISTVDLDPESVVEKARRAPRLEEVDLVRVVTCDRAREWVDEGYVGEAPAKTRQLALDMSVAAARPTARNVPAPVDRYRVVAVDCGIKQNILRHLYRRDCQVIVVPATTSAEEVLSYEPDGVFLSNGPGDPAICTYLIETTKGLIGKVPVFGICLGIQIITWAMGGRTYKLKFGHRGCNHPVKNLITEEVEITTQNHGFCADLDSLKDSGLELTHINLNDNTVEGLAHKDLPLFAVQYHPEAGPGPHDAHYLFDQFVTMMGAG